MPEAVIVATARTPDRPGLQGIAEGRPRRRPGRLHRRRPCMKKVPAVDPASRRGRHHRARPTTPASRAPTWPARSACWRACPTPCRARRSTASAPSSLQSIRMAYHAIKAGEGDTYVAGGVESVSRTGGKGFGREDINPRFTDESRSRLHQPRLHPDGHDRRERGREVRRVAASAWTSSPCCRRTGPSRPRRTASSSGRSRPSSCPTAPSSTKDDVPRPGTDAREAGPAPARLQGGRQGHRRQRLPPQRRRRRRARHGRGQGPVARPHAAGPHRRLRRVAASRPRSWASAPSRRAARCWRRRACRSATSTWSSSTRRSPPRSCPCATRSASPSRTSSTPTAAPSPSATRSA